MLKLPPASSATSAFEDASVHSDEAPTAIDPFSARATPAIHGVCVPRGPSAPFRNSAGQMQRVPVYRLTFASSPCGRVRPGADELSVHPVAGEPDRHDPPQTRNGVLRLRTCRAGPDIGKAATAGPKPPPPFSRPTGEIAARPQWQRGCVASLPPAPVPPRRNALRCIRGRNGTIVRVIRASLRKLRGDFGDFCGISFKVLIQLGSIFIFDVLGCRLPPSALPGISPSGGEIGWARACRSF